jgi:hypothetical protein
MYRLTWTQLGQQHQCDFCTQLGAGLAAEVLAHHFPNAAKGIHIRELGHDESSDLCGPRPVREGKEGIRAEAWHGEVGLSKK